MTVTEEYKNATGNPITFKASASPGYNPNENETELEASQESRNRLSRMLEEQELGEDVRAKALHEQDYDSVVALADQALVENPEDTVAMLDRALALALKGDIDGSMNQNLAVLKLDPKNSIALNNLACDYSDQGNLEMAHNVFLQAHEAHFEQHGEFDPLICENIAGVLEDQGKTAEAEIWRQRMDETAFDPARFSWKGAAAEALMHVAIIKAFGGNHDSGPATEGIAENLGSEGVSAGLAKPLTLDM